MGTMVEMASGMRLNDCCQPPIASVVTQIKNILALQISVQKMVLYIKVPQKWVCSCSSALKPLVNIPYSRAAPPIPIKASDHVFILPGISNWSLIDAILILLCCYFILPLPANQSIISLR